MAITFEFSDRIHEMKYRQRGETFESAMSRISRALSDNSAHEHRFNEILQGLRFLPAGRVQAGAGTAKQVTLFNCYLSGSVKDNFTGSGGIMQRASEAAETMRMGGGIGYDFSELRPRGDLIKTLDSHASGPVTFMDIYDSVCRAVQSAGHRRGAQMGVLRIDHPDIEEFVRAKQTPGRLTNFNVSVGVTDAFMKAVKNKEPFELMFNNRVYKTVDAYALWEEIMRSTWDWAEPGVLFIDRINQMNNLWYCETIAATNPCVPGETLILTDKGYQEIQSLVGKDVNIWNGEDFKPVRPFETGFNDTLVVNLSDGTSLRCTPTHEWCLWSGWSREGRPLRKQAQDLVPGDKLQKFKMPFVKEGVAYGLMIDAYSQGFYEGDGSAGLTKSFVYGPKFPCMERLEGTFGSAGKKDAMVWYHGPMLQKGFVPVDGDSNFCLNWLAGLLDSDGCSVSDENGTGFQISSANKDMLDRVKLMLTRLGVQAKVVKGREEHTRAMPGGVYTCKQQWRLLINSEDAYFLIEQGLVLNRVEHDGKRPQRDARRFVTVLSVEEAEPCKTYCFTEPVTSRGTFNGIVTGQCGEQPLPPNGACLLGSFNLTSYITSDKKFNQLAFVKDIYDVVRAMDNINDLSIYPLQAQRDEALSKRRMGLGITGYANAVERLGMAYGSPGALKWLGLVLAELNRHAYRASTELAKEKGPFPLFDRDAFLKSAFVEQALDKLTKEEIYAHGMRNSHLTSIAPTGTISLSANNISSGIEPVFAYNGIRTVQTFDGPFTADVTDYNYREFGIKGKKASDCTVDDHIRTLLTAQAFVDSSVSKTCNVNPNMPWEDFKSVYVKAFEGGAKGCTTFNPGGKRMGVLVDKEQENTDGAACYIDPETGTKKCE